MEVTIPNTLAVVPKKINSFGRIDGMKKFAGKNAKVVILDELEVFAPIPIGDSSVVYSTTVHSIQGE
jgi:hypothetical protein